jgi:putative ABC transport system permease protein
VGGVTLRDSPLEGSLRADLKFAVRTLRQTPGLSVVAVICLALAIGLTTAAFSIIHSVLLSPLPVPDGDRLVMVHEYHRTGRFNVSLTAEQFTRRRERSVSFDDMAAWFTRNVTLTEPGGEAGSGLLRAAYVSPNALELLGIAPVVGRYPNVADVAPGATPVVVVSHDVWRSRFGSDGQALGRTVQIAGRPHRVIGVMPPGVAVPIREALWIPVQTDSRAANATEEPLTLFGRLAKGVSRKEAAAELAVLAAADGRRDPADATYAVVMPFTRGFMSPEQEWAMYGFLIGLVAFLAVIAANLANLFLARNAARSREIAMRSALGASRRRLVEQLLIESLVLALAGALAGLVVARATQAWFMSQVKDLPWWADFSLNPVVLGFAALGAVIASAVAGIGPAVRLTGTSTSESLKAGGPTSSALRFSRAGAVLLVVQLAVSVGFLSVVGALAQGLFGFSYQKYDIAGEDVLVAQVYLGPPGGSELARPGVDRRQVWQRHFERSREQFERIVALLRDRPGVRNVTYSSHFPGNDVEAVRIEFGPGVAGAPGSLTTRIAQVGPDFFETLGARLVHGRDFTTAERGGPARSVVVNAPFTHKYFARESPLGRTLRLLADSGSTPGPWLEIVGVVPDLGLNPGDEGRADGIYIPFQPSNFARLAVRTETEPAGLVPRLHAIVMRENANAQVQSAETLESQMNAAQAVFRGLGAGLLLIGGTALLLSAVSFYSLVSFGVTRRTREIGIRLALGATRPAIVKGILARELTVIMSGAGAGVLLGAGLYRLVTLVPFDLRPAGPSLLAAAIGLIVFVGAGACIVPARRAMSIEPSDALRHE